MGVMDELSPEDKLGVELARSENHLIRELIAARHRRGLTTADVAHTMDVDHGAVTRFESGGTNPTMAMINRYAEAVGVLIRYSVEGYVDGDLINAAVLVSMRDSAIPSADRERLVEAYGEKLGEQLFGEVGGLVRDAVSMPIDWGEMSLTEGVRDIMTRFGARHPQLSAEALEEIGRCVGWHFR